MIGWLRIEGLASVSNVALFDQLGVWRIGWTHAGMWLTSWSRRNTADAYCTLRAHLRGEGVAGPLNHSCLERQVNLTPGMAVTVEVKTGTRRLTGYPLAPMIRYADESVKER